MLSVAGCDFCMFGNIYIYIFTLQEIKSIHSIISSSKLASKGDNALEQVIVVYDVVCCMLIILGLHQPKKGTTTTLQTWCHHIIRPVKKRMYLRFSEYHSFQEVQIRQKQILSSCLPPCRSTDFSSQGPISQRVNSVVSSMDTRTSRWTTPWYNAGYGVNCKALKAFRKPGNCKTASAGGMDAEMEVGPWHLNNNCFIVAAKANKFNVI